MVRNYRQLHEPIFLTLLRKDAVNKVESEAGEVEEKEATNHTENDEDDLPLVGLACCAVVY